MFLFGGFKIKSINDLFVAAKSPISNLSLIEFVYFKATVFGNNAADNPEVVQ